MNQETQEKRPLTEAKDPRRAILVMEEDNPKIRVFCDCGKSILFPLDQIKNLLRFVQE